MRRGLLALTVLALACGCGLDPTDIPVPGATVRGASYPIRIEFTSVLNLPGKAKVRADGLEVGVVDHVELRDRLAVATVRVRAGLRLPVSTRAEIRQATVLGEPYVALLAPRDSAAPELAAGAVIPASSTRPPDSVEDLLRGMSNVLANGRFDGLAAAVARADAAFPAEAEYRGLAAEIHADLHDLSSGTADLDRILDSAERMSGDLAARKSAVDRALVLGPGRAAGLADVLFGVVDLAVGLGALAGPAGELVWPIYPQTVDIYRAMRPLLLTVASADTTVPMNADKLIHLLRDKLIPYLGAPPNIRVSDPGVRADGLITILRSIGMVP
ncbi:MlaD family protein [Nocardia pseudobrasiliensis]|uniref:Phospholipid/cholesterol/gamma-HCH transport system substrate-binding protein n=1 Tax=Nocardia pseudobrasiliensis TaxID=45979 RepID=A0A370HS10_9NOCA|nr:MlaD family protein [Nocardia pseudobrasiliensis]RDI61298.1 phospholipid/cholesterol/gamma-HCH transport system substrate-binding protein [Nocardia pseudobrasiliensis]